MTKIILTNPKCPKHGSMNRVSRHGMWRCLLCGIGFDEETGKFLESSIEGFKNG